MTILVYNLKIDSIKTIYKIFKSVTELSTLRSAPFYKVFDAEDKAKSITK